MPFVVFPFSSTSNHNLFQKKTTLWTLYFLSLLHQTTTFAKAIIFSLLLYFLSLLHQTTTNSLKRKIYTCCISFLFYIKPQLSIAAVTVAAVVFPFSSTSNHYLLITQEIQNSVVFPFSSTSNHNPWPARTRHKCVVFPFSSTSNHNASINP